MLCFSVDSKDSLENVESKWVSEIAENCHGVKLVLVALKCDLREKGGDEEEEAGGTRGGEKVMIDYKQGLEVAKRIQALRYLGMFCSRTVSVDRRRGERANPFRRVLGKTKPGRQRSIHRSGKGCTFSQGCRHVQWRQQMLCYVSCTWRRMFLFPVYDEQSPLWEIRDTPLGSGVTDFYSLYSQTWRCLQVSVGRQRRSNGSFPM